MLRGVRGATTIKVNEKEQLFSHTKQLLEEMIHQNNIKAEDVASVFVSATPDVTCAFPAQVVRSLPGWEFVPVMCMQEMAVPGSMPKCIRLMMHVNTDLRQQEIHHVYMENAVSLRPDLSTKGDSSK
ncbi:chorismate mutase [Bacillus fonticola]|uniref:chorismate mutase n=1 Tax=Bacillus fonticola TaxID=2728853 RepID=UPI001476498B|nr:chorismate mutase [Bacillus fonticola]